MNLGIGYWVLGIRQLTIEFRVKNTENFLRHSESL